MSTGAGTGPAPPRRGSLRGRLFAALALVALTSVGTTAGLTLVLSARSASQLRLDVLARQADAVAAAVPPGVGPGLRALRVLVARGPAQPVRQAGPARTRAVRRALGGRTPGEGAVTLAEPGGGTRVLYALRATPRGAVALLRRPGPQAGDVRPVGSIVLLSALIGLVLAALLAVVGARRIVRPLSALTRATEPIARRRRTTPVAEEGPREVAALAAAFNVMQEELDAARDAERRFLMTVSHELRTPLTSVRGYAEALADGLLPAAEAATVLAAEAARLERLVEDVLALASLGAATFTMREESVDGARLATAVVTRHAAAARAASVTLRADPCGPSRLLGDETRVLQALSNLVENALRVTPAGGEVIVASGPGFVSVADTGPGLSEEDRRRAFERFHLHRRAGPGTAGSSGLGLALVAELVEAMGGSAAAEPGPGGGTRFLLRLRERG